MNSILIVEDNDVLRRFVASTIRLEYPELTVFQASSIEAARRMTESVIPSMVIIDHRLPDGEGLTLVRELALCSPQPTLLYSSGADETDLKRAAIKAGVSHYLEKPYTGRHLLDLLAKVMGKAGNHGSSPPSNSGLPVEGQSDEVIEALHHQAINKLAGLLVHIRNFESDLKDVESASAQNEQMITSNISVMVRTVFELRDLVKSMRIRAGAR